MLKPCGVVAYEPSFEDGGSEIRNVVERSVSFWFFFGDSDAAHDTVDESVWIACPQQNGAEQCSTQLWWDAINVAGGLAKELKRDWSGGFWMRGRVVPHADSAKLIEVLFDVSNKVAERSCVIVGDHSKCTT